jgi:hypothetical protein
MTGIVVFGVLGAVMWYAGPLAADSQFRKDAIATVKRVLP